MKRLLDRVCVVAGAGGALGGAVAKRFGEEGGIVVGIDREVQGSGQLPLSADLSDERQVAKVYSKIWEAFGRLDLIYNNAGLISPTIVPRSIWKRTSGMPCSRRISRRRG